MKRVVISLVFISFSFFALLANNTSLLNADDDGGGSLYKCSSGGPGSISCKVEFAGGGATFNGKTACSVDCIPGYYACCNAYHNKCQCRKI